MKSNVNPSNMGDHPGVTANDNPRLKGAGLASRANWARNVSGASKRSRSSVIQTAR